MSYADELARVALIWTPNTAWPNEQAVTTFHLRHHHVTGANWDWDTEIKALPQRIAEKLDSHWDAMRGLHATTFKLTGIKAYQLDAQGRTVNEGFFTPAAGDEWEGGSSGCLPPEVAVCLSFYGYNPAGFATHKGRKRGRMYLPYITSAASNNAGLVDATHLNDALVGYAAFFNDVQGMHAIEDQGSEFSVDYWNLVVASSVDASATQVEWLAMDNHFDSQRRRQHQSPATRSLAQLNHS